jgi:hypothetical protein
MRGRAEAYGTFRRRAESSSSPRSLKKRFWRVKRRPRIALSGDKKKHHLRAVDIVLEGALRISYAPVQPKP